MKKRIKKFVAAMMCCCMIILVLGMSVSAAEIQPKALKCGNCSSGVLLPSKSYSAWTYSKESRCAHGYGHGNDVTYERKVTTTYKCNICGAGYSTVSTEKKVECKGYN